MPLPDGMWDKVKGGIPGSVAAVPEKRKRNRPFILCFTLVGVGAVISMWLADPFGWGKEGSLITANQQVLNESESNSQGNVSSSSNNGQVAASNKTTPKKEKTETGGEDGERFSSSFSQLRSNNQAGEPGKADVSKVDNISSANGRQPPAEKETEQNNTSGNSPSDIISESLANESVEDQKTDPKQGTIVIRNQAEEGFGGIDITPMDFQDPVVTPIDFLGLNRMALAKRPQEVSLAVTDDQIARARLKHWHLSFGISGGPGLNYRDLQISADPGLEEHKNQHESQVFMYRGEFFTDLHYRNWVVKAGFGLTRKGEGYAFHHDTIQHTTRNTYSYWSFPLRVGRTFQAPGGLTITPLVGLRGNLLREAQSSWVDPNQLSPVLHDNAGDHSPFREFAMAWTLEGQISTPIARNLELLAIPGYTRFIHSIYKDEVPLKQKPYSFDLNLGLRYRIGTF